MLQQKMEATGIQYINVDELACCPAGMDGSSFENRAFEE
jgi:hypothetical protein